MNVLKEIFAILFLGVIIWIGYSLFFGDPQVRGQAIMGAVLLWKVLTIIGLFYIGWLVVKILIKAAKD